MLFVDSREKGGIVKRCTSELKGEIKPLSAGDYWIQKEDGIVVVERSTYNDFCGKIVSGRLWEQVRKCKDISNDVYFILENPYTLKFSNVSVQAIYAAIVGLCNQVNVITTRSMSETFRVIEILHKKYNDPKKKAWVEYRAKPKVKDTHSIAKWCLEGVPSIGSVASDKLLQGRSIAELCKMSELELCALVSKKQGSILYAVLNSS